PAPPANAAPPAPQAPAVRGAFSDLLDRQQAAPPASTDLPDRRRPVPTAPTEILDRQMLETLEELGGPAFVSTLIDDFLVEAEAVVENLVETAARGDVVAFRTHAHALRSSSVNIGARGLGELCGTWQYLKMAELAAEAPQVSEGALAVLERTRNALLASRSTTALERLHH
ncbi:MAG: Hpt domain-containing protein, partial [Janthinobacterium lividum]